MQRLSLRGRLLLGFIAVLMLPIGSAVWAFRGVVEVQRHTRALAESHYPVLETASRTASRLTTFQSTADRACSSFDAAALDHARGIGCRRIQVDTTRTRESYERSFYTERGFVEVNSALLRCELPPKR